MEQDFALFTFNRGIVSPLSLARVDVKRLALSGSVMMNWILKRLGPMILRPGWKYLFSTQGDKTARHLSFIFATSDTAVIELTDLTMRARVSDAIISRPAVSSSVANSGFSAGTDWTDDDEAGGVSTLPADGYLHLVSNGTVEARRSQQIVVAAPDQGVEHGLHIVINRGPVTLRVGSSYAGGRVGDEYISETTLDTGTHSLALTPTGNFYIQFASRLQRLTLVDSCAIEAAGAMVIAAPWPEASLGDIVAGPESQSGDIIFASCKNYQQYKIERRATRSWSMVKYYSDNGPFDFENAGPITITPSGLTGNITLTASSNLFRSTHVGAMFKLVSNGQRVTKSITSGAETFSDAIRVTGVGATRTFTVIRSNTGTGTVTLQRSLDSATGPWVDVTTYAVGTFTYSDGLDNQIAWYRIGCKAGGWASLTIDVELNYSGGSIKGIARITGYTSGLVVDAEVLVSLGATTATTLWSEGMWSDKKGWPTAVAFHEGRLWWSGKGGIWGSISDNFYSFDEDTVGDSGPIDRTIGSGPVDRVNWMLSLSRLILGAEGAEFVCKSSSLDEIITPSNFNPKTSSTQGSAPVQALKLDKTGIFVTRGGVRVFEVAIDEKDFEYGSGDLTALIPEIGKPSIVRMAIQRQPDTRVHCIRSDGTVALMVIDKTESVMGWCEISTDGLVEDVVILPGAVGTGEDTVYYCVKRTINGVTKRYFEKWALESDCIGGTLNRQADCFFEYAGAAVTTITGLGHLEAKSVVVWGNGKDLGTYVVAAGQISGLPEAVTSAIIGISYTAQWQSTKLAHQSIYGIGSTINFKKNITHMGVVVAHTHYQGLQYGRDFTKLRDMPQTKDGATIAADTVFTAYEPERFEMPGEWDTDARICLQAKAPRPCTVLGITIPVQSFGAR